MLLSVPQDKCGSRGASKTPGEAFSMKYFKSRRNVFTQT
uniref:Uncharacterized protein n=1 Tax=Anguilla anguilla TaxID=7936 RepID=A0A0E9QZN2_ANGAN